MEPHFDQIVHHANHIMHWFEVWKQFRARRKEQKAKHKKQPPFHIILVPAKFTILQTNLTNNPNSEI